MEKSLKLIKAFKLDNYLKDLILYNKANIAPYHNFYHTLTMVKNCYNIAVSEQLNLEQIKNLLVASLFHDFNHSMGKESDEVNVKVALEAFKDLTRENEENNIKIINIIKATQYPYVIQDDKLNISQKIIRDADMLQGMETNRLQQIFFGLMKQELNIPIEQVPSKQLKFFDITKFYTKYAQDVFDGKIESIREDFEYLDKLLN